ncbi:NADH:flavin oxidoreductase/NADH oxidase [Streptomyces alboflavus]|uniref:Oxidoreductase n=1 Tax=Streptomyces alboflavus TaxID=67267 RepID=A0A1Z1WEL7_9ACTN|nr:NADH:flavin oxidoreductase/NADH oxidase [Streptomyces alboflavus]ARX84780.1 oxidoreductase [Streptomyces alboflavus]
MSTLFSPLKLRELTIPNRAWMAPMCQYQADPTGPQAGVVNDWHLGHLFARAAGGLGLILLEATAVAPEGRITPGCLGLWNETQARALTRVTRFLEEHDVVPAIQLAHSGRKGSASAPWLGGGPVAPEQGGWDTVAPSAVAYGNFPTPHELSVDEIQRLVGDFAAAARRALDAGFKVVEVHGAHGFLINSFLSPHSNHRTDAYGGSFERRARFALEVVDAVRAVWPDELPVFFRTSATDWLAAENPADNRQGWTGDDTVRLAKELLAHGVDLLDVSSGGVAHDARITTGPGYQVPYAAAVRAQTDMPVGAVGLITEAEQAEEILASGKADAVLLGRELLRDPHWAHRAAGRLGAAARWPESYGYAV